MLLVHYIWFTALKSAINMLSENIIEIVILN